jgi:hypothetical protein
MSRRSRNRPVEDRRASLGSLKPLVPYALGYKGRIAAALAALALASAATLVLPVAARRVIDHGFSQSDGRLINAYFLVMIAVVGALALGSALRFYLVVTLGERIVADLRRALFERLTRLDPAFFDAARSGEIVSRLTADTTQVKSAFGVSVSMALRNAVLFLGAVGLMVWTSPKLSALVILAIPLIVLPLIFSGRAVQRRSRAAQDRLADATAYASGAHHAGLRHGGGDRPALRQRGRRRLRGGPRFEPLAGASHRSGDLPRLLQRGRRALVGRAGRARRDDERGPAVAIRALRRLRGELARPALRGLWRAGPGGRGR